MNTSNSQENKEMTKPDYKRAQNKAKEILDQNSIFEPPISPHEIAENHGLTIENVIFKKEYKNIAGFIDLDEKKIYVNNEDHVNRQTFTIAHELGHYFLHQDLFKADPKKYTVLLRNPINIVSDPIEKEANAFAAHFLVPKKFLDSYKEVATITQLARMFMVSPEVIRNRINTEY